MTHNDFKLPGKKVLIRVVGIIPLILIAGGLWLTRTLLN